jgi:hypothetical protein
MLHPVRTPNFLVVGAARSGTTALIEGLRGHPDVFITRPKEPHYFAFHHTVVRFEGPGDDHWINQIAITDPSTYLGLYEQADRQSLLGDGSVTTLYYSAHAAPEIERINSQMKLVVLLREPVSRAFSNYTYMRLRGVEPEADFRAGISCEKDRIQKQWHHMWHYTALSKYHESLATLISAVGRDNIGIWFYDQLCENYGKVLTEVINFLGLQSFQRIASMPLVNVSGTARNERAQRAIRWATRHELVRAGVKRVVPFKARERIRGSIVRSESVPWDVRCELAPMFADDLAKLVPLLSEELPIWLTPYAARSRSDQRRRAP